MRAVFGLLLVMLGLAMAIVWMPEHHGERQLAVVTDIATKGIQRSSGRETAADDRSGRTFSPHTPLLASVEPHGARVPHTASVARVVPSEPSGRALAPVTPLITASMPTATVVEAAPIAVPMLRSAEPSLGRPAGAPEMSREELVRNIQRELKRVGCYPGDVDGDWGTGSRRAMTTFTERVNASLPIDQPDFILLALLRGHNGAGCTGPTVAQTRRSTERRVAAVQPPAENEPVGRSGSGGWSANIVTAAPLRATEHAPALPSSATNAIAAAAAAALAAQTPVSPLPGRMAVGGPQNGSAYVTNPPERSPARAAARPQVRERLRRTARRSGPPGGYAYRYPTPAYRPTPPRFYAAASARRTSRNWTANFFGSP